MPGRIQPGVAGSPVVGNRQWDQSAARKFPHGFQPPCEGGRGDRPRPGWTEPGTAGRTLCAGSPWTNTRRSRSLPSTGYCPGAGASCRWSVRRRVNV